jgi:CRP-like cAMP-binding protein
METLLSNSVIAPMLKEARLRIYEKGQNILYPDDVTAHLFVIKRGAVTMYDIDDQGMQKVLHIFGPPALFPMVSFSAPAATVSWFYSALTRTEVYLLPYLELKERLENAEGTAAYNLLLRQLLCEVHELVVRINSGTRTNSLGKLVAALKFLAVHHSRSQPTGWARVVFPVSHQLLADMTGLARETVTISMKQLQQYKAVRNGSGSRLEVHNERLGKIA